jgi:hypothetical protein
MRGFRFICVLVAGGTALVLAFCGRENVPLRERQILSAAAEAMKRHNLDPKDFNKARIHVDATKSQQWSVSYWPKSGVIEADVFVHQDADGKVRVFQGMKLLE